MNLGYDAVTEPEEGLGILKKEPMDDAVVAEQEKEHQEIMSNTMTKSKIQPSNSCVLQPT